jgi:hypothetical protein
MIKIRRLADAMLVTGLLLCAFPKVTDSQEQPSPSTVIIEGRVQSLRNQFDTFKSDFGHRLDRIELLIGRLIKHGEDTNGSSATSDGIRYVPRRGDETSDSLSTSDVHHIPERNGRVNNSLVHSDDSDSERCCRHIYHYRCCRHIYHPAPCCRHVHRPPPCCRQVYPPRPCCRQVYHPQPCCKRVHDYITCCGPIYDPEPWFSELD